MKTKKRKPTKKKITKKSSRKPLKKKRQKTAVKKATPAPTGWIGLELSQRGEAEKDIQVLVDVIRKTLGNSKQEIFVPIYYENEEFFEKNVSLFNGYFFLRNTPGLPYHKLKDIKFFEGVVCNPTTNEPEIIPNEQVETLRAKFNFLLEEASQVRVGQTVRLLDGLYKNLTGKVSRVIKKDKMCIIKITSLKSRNITISAPFMSVTVVESADEKSDVPTFF